MSEMLHFAQTLARQAGDLLRQAHAGGPRHITSKASSVDLVTEVDLASERLMTAALRARFPDHAIFGEESGDELPLHGPVWVLDPVDGTTNFAHGYPVFSLTLALLVDRQIELGVIYDPLRDELYSGVRGRGAWRGEGHPLHVSATDRLGSSLLATGFAYDRATNPDNNLAEFSYFMPRTRGVRRGGSAALDAVWVACGWVDGYWERGVQVWDVAAAVLMIREAGGVVTTYRGEPWQPGHRTILAANAALHPVLLRDLSALRADLPLLE